MPELGILPKRAPATNATEGVQSTVFGSGATPRVTTPRTMTAAAGVQRRSGNHAHLRRPKLRAKSATAPPGLLQLLFTKPQPPRRAISARAARPTQSRDGRQRRSIANSPMLPRISLHGTPASRSLISRRKRTSKSTGRVGLKPKTGVWRRLPQSTAEKYHLVSALLDLEKSRSFSEKSRVQDTLRSRRVQGIETTIVDFGDRQLPETPGSVAHTPRELYGTPKHMDNTKRTLGARSPLGLNMERAAPDEAEHFFLPLTTSTPGSFARSVSVKTARALEDRLWKKNIYIPGPIRLLTPTIAPRSNSITTLEPFMEGVENKTRKFSDLTALEGVISYFQTFGITETCAEDELDQFWQYDRGPKRVSAGGPPMKALKLLGLEEAPQELVQSLPSPYPVKAFKRLGLEDPQDLVRPSTPSCPSSPSLQPLGLGWLQDETQPPASSPSPRSPRQKITFRQRFLNSATAFLRDSEIVDEG
jgi:hypothetical protein